MQIRLLKDPVATELSFTSYEKAAEGLGAKGVLIRNESEVLLGHSRCALTPFVLPAAQIKAGLQRAKELAAQGHPVVVNCLLAKSSFREGSISL